MNLGLVTIAAFLLLLPGVAFIIGVNIADKNVREIVFRNTPSEIGYVVFISVVVHLFFTTFSHFNAARFYVKFISASKTDLAAVGSFDSARAILAMSLSYVLMASVVGFLPGYGLGLAVRYQTGRWTNAFVKHRWMLDLIATRPDTSIYARVVLKDAYLLAPGADKVTVIIQGLLRDSYFAADGTLLYLVFKTFRSVNDDVDRNISLVESLKSIESGSSEQLFIEGHNIAFAQYYARPPLPFAAIEAAVPDV